MKKCSYCGRINEKDRIEVNGNIITREHIFPAFTYQKEEELYKNNFWKKGIQTQNAVKIKDVCDKCNNVYLGRLDYYVEQNLWKIFNEKITYNTKYFTYDFNKLARWLLKVSYNSSRLSNEEMSYQLYEKEVIEYILGFKENLNNFYIFAHIKKTVNPDGKPLKKSEINGIEYGMRCADILSPYLPEIKISRMMGINNYYFYLFYPLTLDPHFLMEKDDVILNGNNRVLLTNSKKSFWDSLEASALFYGDKFDNLYSGK